MNRWKSTAVSAADWPNDGAVFRRLAVAALTVSLLLGLLALAGCGDGLVTPATDTLDDEAALREFMEEEGVFDDVGMYEAGPVTLGGEGREAIDPLTYWRIVTESAVNRTVVVDTLGGTADATIERDVWGELHIVTEEMDEIVKSFHHAGVRYATFARVEDDPEERDGGNNRHRYRHHGWELTEISGFLGQSDDLTMTIDWVRVQGDTVDVTITDPLAMMAVPEEIMLLEVGEEVTVTVSGPPSDAILFLHTRHWRSPLVHNGEAFTGTWTVQRAGRRCAWVTALAHDTIFDSEYPDDWLVWGTPYEVAGEEPGGGQ